MTKKIILGLGALVAVVAGVSAMSAFEAHVINVVAKIENALSVPIDEINFGTVFPQEQLDKEVSISLSQSFIDEDRVDDVKYRIRQKPKCAITTDNGKTLVEEKTATAHVTVENGQVVVTCPEPPRQLEPGESWGVLPLLCPYLSKHKADLEPEKDEELDAFHQIGWVDTGDNPDDPSDDFWVWNDVMGLLTKKGGDTVDNWLIDLKVPCFGNYCAQDWADFVRGINPDADPAEYVQDIAEEHKIFGCDLWIEVMGISLPNGDIGCEAKPDVMLTLDRSGSIDSGELATLKAAAKGFVDALSPKADGSHMGQVSFSSLATLDQVLTADGALVKAAIDALASGGSTNLEDGIKVTNAELASVRDRNDAESPDFMVIITDGDPNYPDGGTARAKAKAEADAAKAVGVVIYVVGVGTSQETADWLKNNIASSPGHYFDASDWDDLQTILEGLATCP